MLDEPSSDARSSRRKRLFLVAIFLCGVQQIAFTQTSTGFSIRVESNRVRVPVSVFHSHALLEPLSEKASACLDRNEKLFHRLGSSEVYRPDDCDDTFFQGLTGKDFHIYEDGVEQTIQSVVLEPLPEADVRDNLGHHNEGSGTASGKWISENWNLDAVPLDVGHFYVIGYVPPKSPEGSCHKVSVRVNRRGAKADARNQYCKVRQAASDPLGATDFGKQLENNAVSKGTPGLPLFVQAGAFRISPDRDRVAIAIEFGWKSLRIEWDDASGALGIMGVVQTRDGAFVQRFSDGDVYGGNGRLPRWKVHSNKYTALLPTGYQTQIALTPGEYVLKIAATNGTDYARAEIPLDIDGYKDFALSSVVLCKRFLDAARAAKEAAAVNLAPQYVPLVSKGVQFEPAGDTIFRKREPLIAYFEVYEPQLATHSETKVQVRLKIRNQQTGEVKSDTGFRPADSWIEPDNSTIHIAENIAPDQLPPGVYRLEVQASNSAGRTTGWRTATFSIE